MSLAQSAQWLSGPERSHTRFGETPLYREGLYRVAADSYAWMVPNGSWGETNIGLVRSGNSTLLIDTCWDLKHTQEILEHSRDILNGAPIDTIINTHADGDHCWGNQLFPGREIIASEACIHQMHHMNPQALYTLKQAGGMFLRHLPIGSIDKFGHYMHNMFKPYHFAPVRIQVPNSSFAREKTLHLNGLEIQLHCMGPAHTDGDTVVHIPERRIAYSGDLLFIGGTPVMWAGPVENIVKGLRWLLSLDVDGFIPGHGPLADKADVQTLIDYWDWAQEKIRPYCDRGSKPEGAVLEILHSQDFQTRPWAHWESPERLYTTALNLYRHWGVKLPQLPGKLGAMNAMREQAKIAFTLPKATPHIMHNWR